MPALDEALAVNCVDPLIVAPLLGDVIATAGGVGGGVLMITSVRRSASKLKYCVSAVILRMCCPAVMAIAFGAATHWNTVQAPVFGTTMEPVWSTPSSET